MRALLFGCLLSLTVVALVGCGKPESGNLVGAWQMQDIQQTWVFNNDGTLLQDGTVETVYVRQEGTYKLDGSKLTLNLSGKVEATSGDPKLQSRVNRINATEPHPKTETWDLAWQSPNEFTITAQQGEKSVSKTFDRKTS